MVTRAVKNLARYGVEKGLIQKCDEAFVINRVLQELGMNSFEPKIPRWNWKKF